MRFGKLDFHLTTDVSDLLAPPVRDAITALPDSEQATIWVCEIDPTLADTAAFCEQYDIGLEVSANCVIVAAKRADRVWYAACMILATDRADVNGIVRRELDARKISFAPMDQATSLTGMEYGGITPIGLPSDWPILIDTVVMKQDKVVIGSGIRGSKILLSPETLAALPNAKVLDMAIGSKGDAA